MPLWTDRNHAQAMRVYQTVDGRICLRSGLTTGVLRCTGRLARCFVLLFDCGESARRERALTHASKTSCRDKQSSGLGAFQ
jgi:hypothetical protein